VHPGRELVETGLRFAPQRLQTDLLGHGEGPRRGQARRGIEVYVLLTGYRQRFRQRHEQVLREVATARPWPPVDLAIVDAASGVAVACAWCTRVRTADGRWMPIRQFLPDDTEHFTLSHGICAACWEQSAGDLARFGGTGGGR
jgi:hypothetical protein